MDIWAGVFLGNILTICFVWGCVQFHKMDYKAPWLAYAAVAMPLIFLAMNQISTGHLPPQFDALTLQ